jgi:CRISPR type I-E-associated protein CasB/Cse2
MPHDADAAPSTGPKPGLVELFASEVRQLENQERRGDLAELRRMDPERPDAPAFFRMLVRHRPDADPDFARRCARLVRLLALRPEALQAGSLGKAMAKHGISEARVQKLLAARGETLAAQIALIARRLEQERTLPYSELGDLLLRDDDGEAADRIRLRIASDYFRALDHASAADAA